MKKSNMNLNGVSEGKEKSVSEEIFEEITAENFPKFFQLFSSPLLLPTLSSLFSSSFPCVLVWIIYIDFLQVH